MSRKIHVGPEGQIGICSAYRGECPYAAEGVNNHFENPKDAYAYAEKVVEDSTPEHQKLISMNKKAMKKAIKNYDKSNDAYDDYQMRTIGPRGSGWHDPIDVSEMSLGRRFRNFFWSNKDNDGMTTRAAVFGAIAIATTLVVVQKISGVPFDAAASAIPDGMGFAIAAGTVAAVASPFFAFVHNGIMHEFKARGPREKGHKATDEIDKIHEDLEKFRKRPKADTT